MSNDAGAMPERGPRHLAVHGTVRSLLRALTVLLLACLAALGAAPVAGAADGDDLIKVFVVEDPAQTGGELATLGSIAAVTLGDTSRASEIFDLNRGLAQKDGAALNSPDDQLRPGWILRLPQDAGGPQVQLARDTSSQSPSPAPTKAPGTAPPVGGDTTADQTDATFTIPLAAAVAVLGALLLALVTAGIVGRRKVRAACAAMGRAVGRLGEPVRRRRRLLLRRAVGRRFATDADSVRRAYGTLGEFAATRQRPETPVHALRVDNVGVTVWLTASDTVDAPWQNIDSTRWRRPANAVGFLARGGADSSMTAQNSVMAACLVRVGTDADGEPVFVDLSRLDGVLSVTGEHTAARDVVQNLLSEIARTRPDTPVTVLGDRGGAVRLTVPPGLRELPPGSAPAPTAPAPEPGTVRAAASRRPVKGLVVLADAPTEQEAAELVALCGPGGAGWTGLVCGETSGAHWHWHADADGQVDIPVLDVKLTVPA